MAASTAGTRSTEQHRLAQLEIRAAALREVLALWPLLDPVRLDATTPAWLALMLGLIRRWRVQSAVRAASYYAVFHVAEHGTSAPARVPVLPSLDPARVETSLTVTGPVRVKRLTGRGRTPEEAARTALAEVSGAASRYVLDGGRAELDELVRADPVALGWARVTDSDPCAFCALLASRGPAYKTAASAQRTVTGQAYHDACSCAVEPVFSRDQPWPGRGREFWALYESSTEGFSGKDARNAFRRAYQAQRTQ